MGRADGYGHSINAAFLGKALCFFNARDEHIDALVVAFSAADAAKMKPWISLAEKLGAFAGQLTETSIQAVEIVYAGTVASLNLKALTQAALAGLLKPALPDVNMVNAPAVAKERGIVVQYVERAKIEAMVDTALAGR